MRHLGSLLLTLSALALLPACGDMPTGGATPDMAQAAPTCSDGLKNQTETDVDCGGPCATCATGKACAVDTDCATALCRSTQCVAPSCTDGVKNQGETDVDCGGSCSPCANDKACVADKDCATSLCRLNRCVAPSCMDGVKDQDETDADCGGAKCGPCQNDRACLVDKDCATSLCRGNLCVAPSCMDGVKDQDETDADCGGTKCAACINGKTCAVDKDCATMLCRNTLCVAPSCMDGVKNQDETDADCGGALCGPCALNKVCLVDKDCATSLCRGNLCVAPSCMDVVKNQDETDVDCGGTKCGPCANGKSCLKDSDCTSKACAANKCVVAPTLTSVSPVCGPLAGGTQVTIFGQNFPVPSTPSVVFGATAAPLFKANDATTIVVTSPAAAAGVVSVIVNGLAGGTLSLPAAFRYVDVLPATLSYAAETTVGFSPSGALAVGDFSGDGRLDYIQEHSAGHLDLAIGVAAGGFTNVTSLPVAGVTKRMIGVDVNNDNKADVVGTIATNVLSVYTSTGTTLNAHVDYATNTGPEGLVAVNLNNDAFADIAVIHSGADFVSVFINNGNGTYKAKVDYAVPRGVAIVGADFDGDGKADLATIGSASSAAQVLISNGDGTLKAAVAYPLPASAYALVSGDFNGDGKIDLAAANGGSISVLLNKGNGTFANGPVTAIPSMATTAVLRAADVDGNGTLDLVILNTTANRAEIWLNNCLGGFVSANKTFAVTGGADLWLGDFNADTKLDLIHGSTNGVRIINRQ